ncbi:hypothetical protein SORBI_3006G040600 [Sorghum bicolor]|uniref:Uncharacterized protein n=1 Tax=Sorghum bicolor TaxID=4558 RepID=A0A1B6PK02_SORBI|nr:hypothetical protein SORBI_3006G040600 [Sorghum bicolor]
MCSPRSWDAPVGVVQPGTQQGRRSRWGLLHGLSLKKMKLGAVFTIFGKAEGVGSSSSSLVSSSSKGWASSSFFSSPLLLLLSSPFPLSLCFLVLGVGTNGGLREGVWRAGVYIYMCDMC